MDTFQDTLPRDSLLRDAGMLPTEYVYLNPKNGHRGPIPRLLGHEKRPNGTAPAACSNRGG